MKILVTGANGYIGSKVVEKLCNYGIEVIATDLNNNNIDQRAKFISANIFELKENWFNFFEKPDVCLHMAWRDGFIHDSVKHMGDLSAHFSFLTNLIDNGLKQIVCMGSMHEVGYFEGPIDENTPCKPLSQYGIAKNALREALQLYSTTHGASFQWLRAFYIYGDDEIGNSIFCKIRKAVKEGKTAFPFTTGKNQYDFININELAEQISHCVMQKKILGIINCCSGKPVSLANQVEWYIAKNHLPITLEYGKYLDRLYDSPCIYGNSKKIHKIEEVFYKEKAKILITGAKGQLGSDCLRELHKRGFKNIKAIDYEDLDITNQKEVLQFIIDYRPNVVMHNAAWTSVDKAEQFPEIVFDVNSNGTKYVAEACKLIGAKMVYISTDYVFEGKGDKPFEIDDPKSGLSVYGKSKALGEDYVQAILEQYYIVRISWAFGKNGNNFVNTMINLAKKGTKEINVVNDQIGSVTYTHDLSKLLCDMIITDNYGIYHATNEGYISWADFARAIFVKIGANTKVNSVTTEEYMKLIPQQAIRPLNSRLSKKSLDNAGFSRLPSWENALDRYLKEAKK